jgi:CTP:molybdopterin cytidylyltransferase MocA
VSRLLGAVLAGGQSRRFGSDKALAELDDRPLIAHAAAALEPYVDTVAICGRAFAPYLALADRPAPGLGPLGGLAAALRHAADNGFAQVLSIGCDVPALPAALVEALIADLRLVARERRGPARSAPCFDGRSIDAQLAHGVRRTMVRRGYRAGQYQHPRRSCRAYRAPRLTAPFHNPAPLAKAAATHAFAITWRARTA